MYNEVISIPRQKALPEERTNEIVVALLGGHPQRDFSDIATRHHELQLKATVQESAATWQCADRLCCFARTEDQPVRQLRG